jgi:Family of unknown function (DUF6266)
LEAPGRAYVICEANLVGKKKRDVSLKVEIQRAKFKLAASFVKTISSLLAITFPQLKSKMTPRNKALSSVLQQAITGDYPDLRIEEKLTIQCSVKLRALRASVVK